MNFLYPQGRRKTKNGGLLKVSLFQGVNKCRWFRLILAEINHVWSRYTITSHTTYCFVVHLLPAICLTQTLKIVSLQVYQSLQLDWIEHLIVYSKTDQTYGRSWNMRGFHGNLKRLWQLSLAPCNRKETFHRVGHRFLKGDRISDRFFTAVGFSALLPLSSPYLEAPRTSTVQTSWSWR
jgi:hypothetical protein